MANSRSISARLLIFVILILFSNSCRKDELIPVSGLISDPNLAVAVEGVVVEIWTQQIEGGIFTANYVLAATDTTGSDGTFSFNLENKSYTGIRLKFYKSGYYSWEPEINLDKIKENRSFFAEYQLLPKAQLSIHVKNTSPFNQNDYFEFRILNGYTGCEVCCKGEKYQFQGININQTIDCQTVGHQNIIFEWSTRKNDVQIIKTEIHFIEAFETTEIELFY